MRFVGSPINGSVQIRQGHSGLGLEAQMGKVQAMAAERVALIPSEFVDVESGRKNDRPQLAEA